MDAHVAAVTVVVRVVEQEQHRDDAETGESAPDGAALPPNMWTKGLQRLRLEAGTNSVKFVGPFQLVWKVGDRA